MRRLSQRSSLAAESPRLFLPVVARPKELLIQIDQRIAWTREIMGIMNQRKAKKESAKATLAEVTKEMAKPRVAKSARERSSAPSVRSSNRGEQR
jgi:hypothetical protein